MQPLANPARPAVSRVAIERRSARRRGVAVIGPGVIAFAVRRSPRMIVIAGTVLSALQYPFLAEVHGVGVALAGLIAMSMLVRPEEPAAVPGSERLGFQPSKFSIRLSAPEPIA